MPAGALLLSPWVDLTSTHPAEGLQQPFFGHDIISPCKAAEFRRYITHPVGMARSLLATHHKLCRAYVGGAHVGEACLNPLVSPALGSLYGLPPMWINAGARAMHCHIKSAFVC